MKFCTIAAVLIVSLFATSKALPTRLAYYQQPSFFYPSLASPQRLMLLPYGQQPSPVRTHSRLTNDEQQTAEESATSAEYEEPQYYSGLEAETVEITQDSVQEVIPESSEDSEVPQVAEDLPIAETNVKAEPESVAVPEIAAVDQPQEVANDEDAEGDTIDVSVAVPKPSAKRAPKATPQPPLTAGTFFPITFNGHSGSAIAVANSFSTGEGGSATSHAIAYGQPAEAPKPRSRPDRRH